jgi:hypothetical protein
MKDWEEYAAFCFRAGNLHPGPSFTHVFRPIELHSLPDFECGTTFISQPVIATHGNLHFDSCPHSPSPSAADTSAVHLNDAGPMSGLQCEFMGPANSLPLKPLYCNSNSTASSSRSSLFRSYYLKTIYVSYFYARTGYHDCRWADLAFVFTLAPLLKNSAALLLRQAVAAFDARQILRPIETRPLVLFTHSRDMVGYRSSAGPRLIHSTAMLHMEMAWRNGPEDEPEAEVEAEAEDASMSASNGEWSSEDSADEWPYRTGKRGHSSVCSADRDPVLALPHEPTIPSRTFNSCLLPTHTSPDTFPLSATEGLCCSPKNKQQPIHEQEYRKDEQKDHNQSKHQSQSQSKSNSSDQSKGREKGNETAGKERLDGTNGGMYGVQGYSAMFNCYYAYGYQVGYSAYPLFQPQTMPTTVPLAGKATSKATRSSTKLNTSAPVYIRRRKPFQTQTQTQTQQPAPTPMQDIETKVSVGPEPRKKTENTDSRVCVPEATTIGRKPLGNITENLQWTSPPIMPPLAQSRSQTVPEKVRQRVTDTENRGFYHPGGICRILL